MKKKHYFMTLAFLTVTNIAWAMGYAIVGDFYPHLENLKDVLHAKAIFNGTVLAVGLMAFPAVVERAND